MTKTDQPLLRRAGKIIGIKRQFGLPQFNGAALDWLAERCDFSLKRISFRRKMRWWVFNFHDTPYMSSPNLSVALAAAVVAVEKQETKT